TFGTACALGKEIGIATEILDRRKRDRVDALLDRSEAAGWNFRDPVSERSDKLAEFAGGERSVDPAVSFSQRGGGIPRAQHNLERRGAPHEAGEMLHAAATRNDPKCRFRLSKDGRLAGGKAHVARQHKFIARGTDAALDLGDADETACAQVAKHQS